MNHLLPLLLVALPQSPEVYSITSLPGHLPTNSSVTSALNDRGAVVGYGIESLWFEGAHWPDPQTVVNLTSAFGFEASYAYGINDLGELVGSASFDASVCKETAFIARPGQAPEFLPQLVEDELIASFCADITESGLICGGSDTVPGLFTIPYTHAVLWENGQALDLGTLGGDHSQATALNESKLVVGISNLELGGLIRAFAWTESTGMVQLPGLLPGARSVAIDVNEAGVIAGDVDGVPVPAGISRAAAMWTDPQTLVALPLFPGDEYDEGAAINNHDQVVGRGRVDTGFEARLWQNGDVFNLDALTQAPGLVVTEAGDINDRGQILATAWDFSVSPAQQFNVILTPDLQWTDLGSGLAGTHGEPALRGFGTFLPGSPIVLETANALESTAAWLFLSTAALNVPLLGGTLVPDPSPPAGIAVPLNTDANGELEVSFPWPAGVPAQLQLWYQIWVLDAGAPRGVSASNALRSTSV